MNPLDAYLRRSKAARVVLAIYRIVRDCDCEGLTATWMAGVLVKRFGRSTVRHAVTELCRLPERNGKPPLIRTNQRWRRSRVIVAR